MPFARRAGKSSTGSPLLGSDSAGHCGCACELSQQGRASLLSASLCSLEDFSRLVYQIPQVSLPSDAQQSFCSTGLTVLILYAAAQTQDFHAKGAGKHLQGVKQT